jgi:NDP-sugar pyrophosphorylase family protein
MKGMILAAGFGTRFRPATYEIPKPLVPLCNRPLIGWALEAMLAAGVSRVVVNLHHLPDRLEAFLRTRYGSRCDFFFSREEEILGTGGGIRRVRPQLEGDEPFLLANGDTVQIPPFRELAAACRENGALAALLLRRPPAHDRFTKVFFDGLRVTGFGHGTGEALMFAGAHAISPAIFELLPDREFSGITEDVYMPAAERGSLVGVPYEGPWFDIGTPARYMEATAAIRRMMIEGALPVPEGSRLAGEDSIAATGAVIGGEIRGSVAAERAIVEPGARVAGSVLWEGAVVPRAARVSEAIIGEGVSLPAGSVVEGALVCRRLPGVEYPEGTILAGDLAWVAVRPGAEHVEIGG